MRFASLPLLATACHALPVHQLSYLPSSWLSDNVSSTVCNPLKIPPAGLTHIARPQQMLNARPASPGIPLSIPENGPGRSTLQCQQGNH